MFRKLLALLIALACFSVFAYADKKERDWKTGKVLDTESQRFTTYGGSTTQGQIRDDGTYSGTTTRSSWNHKRYVFAIEGDDYIYIVSHVLSFRWSKEVQVTVNGTVKYAVEKNNFYLLDENGREFKLKIDKKILKEKK